MKKPRYNLNYIGVMDNWDEIRNKQTIYETKLLNDEMKSWCITCIHYYMNKFWVLNETGNLYETKRKITWYETKKEAFTRKRDVERKYKNKYCGIYEPIRIIETIKG